MHAVVAPPRYVARRYPQAIRWRGFAGLGQDDGTDYTLTPPLYSDIGTQTGSMDTTGNDIGTQFGSQVASISVPTTSTPTASSGGGTPTSNSGFNWGSLLAGSVAVAGKTAAVATLPAGSIITPSGTVQIGTGTSSLTAANLSAILPLLLLVGVGGLVLVMASHR